MNKLTVARIAPRREIKLAPALRTALTCRWVQDTLGQDGLSAIGSRKTPFTTKSRDPSYAWRRKAASRSIGRRSPTSVSANSA